MYTFVCACVCVGREKRYLMLRVCIAMAVGQNYDKLPRAFDSFSSRANSCRLTISSVLELYFIFLCDNIASFFVLIIIFGYGTPQARKYVINCKLKRLQKPKGRLLVG